MGDNMDVKEFLIWGVALGLGWASNHYVVKPKSTFGKIIGIVSVSYTAKNDCSCATPELLATTSGGCVSKLATGSVPQELVGCAIAPEEFADGCARVDEIAKNLVPGGSMVLRMIVLPMLMVLGGGALMGIGATICAARNGGAGLRSRRRRGT